MPGAKVSAGSSEVASDSVDHALRALVDAASVPVWQSDPGGDCIYVNAAWREFTGRGLNEALRDGWSEAVHPEDRNTLRSSAAAALGQRAPIDLEYRLSRFDGSWRWLQERRRPLFRDGVFVGVIGCGVDLTDFRDKDTECREAIAARDRLLAELQHRVRNNAQASASFLALQANRASEPRVAAALRAAARRIALATLVQELMVADPTRGVDLGEAVAAAARAAVDAASDPSLRLDLALVAQARLSPARAQPLTLAATELVVNAALHAYPRGAGGRIGVGLHAEDRGLVLSVADDGMGLPRRRSSRTPTGQLGLDLATRLARQAGATLAFGKPPGTLARLSFNA